MGTITHFPADRMTGEPLGPAVTRARHTPSAEATPADAPAAHDDPTDPYPESGSVAAVVEWVDRAPEGELRSDRAKAATASELGRDNPRSTLLPQLAERTGD